MNPLKWIGSLFIYTSPDPKDGYRTFLRYKSSRDLQKIAGTPSHYSKTILISMIVDGYK